MYCVSPALYHETAVRLADAAGRGNYFSGSLEFPFGTVVCRLTVSVIVYRSRLAFPEGERSAVTDLVPVWWEFRTSDECGESLNDFAFSELKGYLL